MCLISFAWRAHPQFDFVLAANRDEFHDRAAAAAGWWTDAPGVYGGRDLTQGGGWLAVNRQQRLAAVTNVRRMVPPNPAAPSRGKLVADFVRGTLSAADYAQQLSAGADDYAGFNLLLFDGRELRYLNNHPGFENLPLTSGVHAVSNATLDTPWPKLRRLKLGMSDWTARGSTDHAQLLALLADDRVAADAELPDTGVGLELERLLSPPFIRGPVYGTRASTVVTLDKTGRMEFVERRHGANGVVIGETRENFQSA
jgi:uncharacterized protein with NRDE domain